MCTLAHSCEITQSVRIKLLMASLNILKFLFLKELILGQTWFIDVDSATGCVCVCVGLNVDSLVCWVDARTPPRRAPAEALCRNTVCRAEEPPSSRKSAPPSPSRSLYLRTHKHTGEDGGGACPHPHIHCECVSVHVSLCLWFFVEDCGLTVE